jgi:hypothetical protein
MVYTLNHSRLTLGAIVAMFILAPLSVAHSQTPPSTAGGMEAIAHQLADKFDDFDRKGVLVLDMSTPEYPWLPFGASLADQFSTALAKTGHELEVIDRLRLKAALDAQHLSPKDEFDMKAAIALAKSLGANTLILGSFGAAENGIGVSVIPIRVSDNGIPQQRTFTTDLVRGRITLTRETAALLKVPVDSLRPKDGIAKAGVGGVGVPFCLKCAPPSMRPPEFDIQRLAREKRNGGVLGLDFVVTADGRVSQVTVTHPLGFGIEEQYQKAMKDWEYKPALDADDKPVPVRMQIKTELNFDFSGMYSTSPPQPNVGNTIEAITRQLTDKFKEADKKSVLVVDLSTPEYPWLPFGAWLADQFSAAFAKTGHELEVVDRLQLKVAMDTQHLSPKDEFQLKNAIALAKSIGANTLILGSFGAAENGVGVTLVGFRLSELGPTQSNSSMIGMVFGRIDLTPEIASHLEVTLDSLRPKDGIARAGIGGVSIPSCVRCPPPSMHVPDIDLQSFLREKRGAGTIVLQLVVTAEGRVVQVTVAQPIGYGVDEQYIKAAKDFEFKPAVDADNKPVAVHTSFTMMMKTK